MAVRYKSNLLYRVFAVTEMPGLFAITGSYNIHGKEIVTYTEIHFQAPFH